MRETERGRKEGREGGGRPKSELQTKCVKVKRGSAGEGGDDDGGGAGDAAGAKVIKDGEGEVMPGAAPLPPTSAYSVFRHSVGPDTRATHSQVLRESFN